MLRLRLGRLRLRDFNGIEFPGVRRSHSLIFLNACHSGRMVYDTALNVALFGFAEVFLRKGAAAVIGTLGEVETQLASQVAADIIDHIAHSSETSVAAAIRDVRAAAAAHVEAKNPSVEALKRFLYTFMYLLWGSPYATAQLKRNGGGNV